MLRSGKEIPEIDLVVFHPAQFVDGELRPVVVKLHQPFDLDEIVAVERLDDLRDVVPHLGVDLARAVGKDQREIRLSRAFLPDFLRADQEYGSGNFVRLQFPHERRLHCGFTGTGGTGTGVCGTGVTVGGGAGLASFGPLTWP